MNIEFRSFFKYDCFEEKVMSLITAPEVINSHARFGQVGNLISSSGVFPKQSLAQIADTEISFCNISSSDFADVFKFEIIDVVGNEFSEQIVFELEYSDKFLVRLKLNGYWELGEEPKFQLADVDWNFEEKENNPTSAFTLETFRAILCLSNKVKVEIPAINYYFRASVPLPLNKISEILQNRQIAYRLMVIEKAFQTSLPFPRRLITGNEVESIAFCYHAITDRQFEWACNSFTVLPPAAEENLKYFPPKNAAYHLTFPTLCETRVIFNHELSLGQFMIDIEKASVENYEEVKEEFANLNGEPVEMIIKPLNGKIKYTSLNAPHLPRKAWKNEIQKLINLDEKLNSIFLERYFNLATSTLEGLSQNQKESITERPRLSIKGFD